jgi:SAM-dependent methyltransferase
VHRNSLLLFERYARDFFTPGMQVLEIGPGQIPSHYYSGSLPHTNIAWDTVDISNNPHLTYRASSEYEFPIPNDTYDLVISGQVIEHVRKIWIWIKEVARVCKPGGIVVTINPVSWPFHEAPVDCWRIYPEGMRTLYQDASLDVLLSQCESLESREFSRVIAGKGRDWQSREELELSDRLYPLGAPVECAFDTITIGRKPGHSTSERDGQSNPTTPS